MTNDFKTLYPTWGHLAREQVRRRGLAYFGDVQEQIRVRLAQLLPLARKTFALSCAERLMRLHESLPPAEQRRFTLGCRPTLDLIWRGLAVESDEATTAAWAALHAFHASRYDHAEGEDGPDDADEDAAAGAIYACECFVSGTADTAYWASARAIDAAFRIAEDALQLDANDFVWDPGAEPMPLAKEAMHPVVQAELAKQLSDLAILEGAGDDRDVVGRLR
jgi:hypothetical protein